MRFLVVHMGGRRDYAIPAAFARNGMLESFYTDICNGRGIGRLSDLGSRLPVIGPSFSKLARRRPPPEVLARTVTFDFAAAEQLCRLRRASSAEERARVRYTAGLHMGEAMIRRGFGMSTHLFTVFGEGYGLLAEAKRRGLKVITDINVALSSEAIMIEEQRRFSGWEDSPLYWGETLTASDPTFRPTEHILAHTDLFLCPSDFVCDDLIKNFGVAPEKTQVVPYSVHESWFGVDNRPQRGRVLTVSSGLRKGTHYLAFAASLLAERGRSYEVRVVGSTVAKFRAQPECRNLQFADRVPRTAMPREFAAADVFALPSLAEGSAAAVYEALAAGIPVVTTRETGTVVRDGLDGFIVPSRDPEALAQAIETIVEDRELRASMAVSARARARAFDWNSFERRLISACRGTDTQSVAERGGRIAPMATGFGSLDETPFSGAIKGLRKGLRCR